MPNPIICGPLVRKVTSDSVSVFVALNEFRYTSLLLYSDPQKMHPIAQVQDDPKRLGKKLWVIVITLKDLGLVSNKNYYYNLRLFNNLDGTTEDLTSLGFLRAENPILGIPLGYEADHLPGFALPPGLDNLNIIHGSCRKPHGHGPDQLAKLDELIQNTYTEPLARPHQLFLTGDQIYSDDVGRELFVKLTQEGFNLLGLEERITDSLKHGDADTQVDNRQDFIEDHTELTSGHNEHHLVFLAEFYAMYLFAWSGHPFLSEELLEEHVFLPRVNHRRDMDTGRITEELLESDLTVYAHTLNKVRRALANIPTYMMFDDHEVTDDWYMYGKWKADALEQETTRRIIRNGLIAYAVFQDWGNQPDKYESNDLFWNAVEYVETGTVGKIQTLESPAPNSPLSNFLGLNPADHSSAHNWHFRLSFTAHDVYVIDTRTRRGYDGDYTMLIPPETFNEQMPVPADTSKLAFLLSPAPVLGMPIIEDLQRWAVKQIGIVEATTLDDEAWLGDPATFNLLLEHLARFKQIIILSGDVHYAYTNNCSFFPGATSDNRAARIVQLCSSSLRNGGGLALVPPIIDFALKEESFAFYASSVLDQIDPDEPEPDLDPVPSDLEPSSFHKLNPRPEVPITTLSIADLKSNDASLAGIMDVQQTQARYVVQYLDHDLADQYDPATYVPEKNNKIVANTNLGQVSFEGTDNERYVVHQLHTWKGQFPRKTFTCRTLITPPHPSEKPAI